jgi:WD40 repeat protein
MDIDNNDGLRIVASNSGSITPSVVSLKSLDNGSKLLHLLGHQGEVFMCVWNPTQSQLASGSADGMCRLWGIWEMDSNKWNESIKDKEQVINLKTAILPHSSFVGERYKDGKYINHILIILL